MMFMELNNRNYIGKRKNKVMKRAGVWNLVMGIVMLIVGVSAGVGSIIIGSILLRHKSDTTF